ncbi:hypothetical protein Ae201684P_009191 [Aphanomyces euteiches]|uniref:Uncharacterized protein n=1 Tax=Aphanomyces euteiches TaxID=100861 RepID=A0A6G0WHY8_9STRA|nr:hypothetical protein Ae201684_015062 [Aphanomyces euteiches]KAH9062925.1 hypothetical protein Ae201684P_009191 [Aphanomyces euteiches]KAH9135125.1 hypothetical protein AeRB84_019345 [Aphanomyces euteiches]
MQPHKTKTKQLSIAGMIGMTVFLTLMDIKDLYTRFSCASLLVVEAVTPAVARVRIVEAQNGGCYYIHYPLAKIISYAVLFSFIVRIVRGLATMAWKHHNGKLLSEVEQFWRKFRNSVEVFMNNPLRGNALIRSQAIMSYKFGRSVFIRPFVYLEQNYYIARGMFRMRSDIPFLHNEDANDGADVDTQSYS